MSHNEKRNVRNGPIHRAGVGVCMFVEALVPNSFSNRSEFPQTYTNSLIGHGTRAKRGIFNRVNQTYKLFTK